MSQRALEAVRDYSRATGSARLVLAILASYVFEPQVAECWPAVPTIARGVGLSERQTQAVIRRLIDDGELTLIAGGGRNNTNRYRLACVRRMEETPQPTTGFKAANRAETPQPTTGFRRETPQPTTGFSEKETPYSAAGFSSDPAETLLPVTGFTGETLLQTAPEVIRTRTDLDNPAAEGLNDSHIPRHGNLRVSFFAPTPAAIPIQMRAAMNAVEEPMKSDPEFMELWAEWLQHKGPIYYSNGFVVRRQLKFLARQPDPREPIEYALRTGRDTIVERPAAVTAAQARTFTARPQTLDDANARAVGQSAATYLSLTGGTDDTIF